MSRRTIRLLAILALSLLVAPLLTAAQPSAHIPRIGFLFPGPAALASLRLEPFRQALRELGYLEGQNLAMETGWADGQLNRLPDLAAELVRLQVNVIMTAAITRARRGVDGVSRPSHLYAPGADRRVCGQKLAPSDVWRQGVCRGGRPDVLWAELP